MAGFEPSLICLEASYFPTRQSLLAHVICQEYNSDGVPTNDARHRLGDSLASAWDNHHATTVYVFMVFHKHPMIS